jgi:hypothetical protein
LSSASFSTLTVGLAGIETGPREQRTAVLNTHDPPGQHLFNKNACSVYEKEGEEVREKVLPHRDEQNCAKYRRASKKNHYGNGEYQFIFLKSVFATRGFHAFLFFHCIACERSCLTYATPSIIIVSVQLCAEPLFFLATGWEE